MRCNPSFTFTRLFIVDVESFEWVSSVFLCLFNLIPFILTWCDLLDLTKANPCKDEKKINILGNSQISFFFCVCFVSSYALLQTALCLFVIGITRLLLSPHLSHWSAWPPFSSHKPYLFMLCQCRPRLWYFTNTSVIMRRISFFFLSKLAWPR